MLDKHEVFALACWSIAFQQSQLHPHDDSLERLDTGGGLCASNLICDIPSDSSSVVISSSVTVKKVTATETGPMSFGTSQALKNVDFFGEHHICFFPGPSSWLIRRWLEIMLIVISMILCLPHPHHHGLPVASAFTGLDFANSLDGEN